MIGTEFGRFLALQFVTLAELFQRLKPKLPPDQPGEQGVARRDPGEPPEGGAGGTVVTSIAGSSPALGFRPRGGWEGRSGIPDLVR